MNCINVSEIQLTSFQSSGKVLTCSKCSTLHCIYRSASRFSMPCVLEDGLRTIHFPQKPSWHPNLKSVKEPFAKPLMTWSLRTFFTDTRAVAPSFAGMMNNKACFDFLIWREPMDLSQSLKA